MAVADELVAVLKIDNSQLLAGLEKARAGLQEMSKALGQTTENGQKLAAGQEGTGKAMEGVAKKAKGVTGAFKDVSGAFMQARSSFLSFRTILTGFLAGAGITQLTQSVTRIANLSQITGQSASSIRALGNVFEQLGYSAGEAEGIISTLSDDVARAGYSNNVSPLLANMRAFGVAFRDEKGKRRDVAEMLIEFGDAVKKMSRDTEEAQERLIAMGASHAQAAFMTADNNRQMLAEQKANAAVWEEEAKKAKELNRYIKQLQQTFTDLGLQVLPIVTPLVNDMTKALTGAVKIAREHPEGLQMAIKAIGLAAMAAKGPVGMLLAALLALKELYEAAKGWLGEESDKPEKERDSAVQIRQNVVSGKGEAVDASQYDIQPQSKKTGDWATGAYKAASSWLDMGVEAFGNAWGKDPGNEKATEKATEKAAEKAEPGNDDDLREKIRQNLMQREGVRLDAYQDSKGVWTIGYGHTQGVKRGDRITKEQAAAFLKEDMKTHVDPALALYAGHSDKTKMLAADLAYNAGLPAIQKGSQFWKLAQQGEISQADYAKLYNYSGKKFLPGLVNRRNATYTVASGLSEGTTPHMTTLAGNIPAQTINNHTTHQDIKNDVRVTVATAKEAKEVISPYTTGQKVNGRMDSGTAV